MQPPTPISSPIERGAYISFTPAGVETLSGYNVSSYTDLGGNKYQINFAMTFDTSNIICTPVGLTPRKFEVLEVSPGSITVQFDGIQPPNQIALRLEEVSNKKFLII